MGNLTVKQKKVASLIQKDIAVQKFPFRKIASLCGLTEEKVLEITGRLLKKGLMRKFGAVLRHQKAGFGQNALVVWSVHAGREEKMGRAFAEFPFVSHCYQREPAFMNQYNIFTMLHANDKSISALIDKMVIATGIHDYLILESLKEYKKTSPEYF